ncbi:MAG: L,D-transpeptidase [Gemmatimonadota bacterium]|nr:L,D-transpeptidase [Gemmatimonadota bacterium]
MSLIYNGLALFLLMLAGGVAAPAAARAEAPAGNEVYLVVDLSERMLYVMRGDEVVGDYQVAVGKPEHPTPTGEFRIRRLVWNPRWVPPEAKWARGKRARAPGDPRNPMGRVKIFFSDPDYYIHGTREVDSLGEAESHGCVRMRNADVIALAKTVMETGGARREPAWYKRVVNRVTRTQEVRLSNAVRVTVRK